MEVDSPPELPKLKPRDRIVWSLAQLGVPEEFLCQFKPGLVAFVKNNKQWIPQLVSAILPADEEMAEALNEAKQGSRTKSPGSILKKWLQESMSWLQWLMFEGDPEPALENLSKMSTGKRGVCGAVWGHNDIAYRCRTCEHDPTCAICVPCFQNGNHQDHDYSLIYTGGGCCDCGDITAWKREGFCSEHKGADEIQPLPEELGNIVGPVLDCVFISWKKKLLLAETMCQENPRANDHVAECRKIASDLTFAIIDMLLEFCKHSESLLSFVSKMILASVDLLGILVRAERFLGEPPAKRLHELLLKLLGEPAFKYEFAKAFLSYYPTVVSEARKDFSDHPLRKYPLLGVFSVQIFTVPTLTPRLVKEMNLLSMLMGCLEDIFKSCAGDDGRLQVSKWSNLYEISIRVIEDIRFVMSHATVPKYVTHDQQDISKIWMRLLAFVQGMSPQKRETGIRIEEENENMHLPFALGHSISNIHSLLVDGAFSVDSDKLDKGFQDMDDRDNLRHAKVGRLSQESSACSAVGSSSFACASNVGGDKLGGLSDFLIPPSVMWLTYECLRAIENWLGVDNTSGALLDASSPSMSNFSGSNFSALKRTLSKIRKGKYIFGRLASSSEDHGKQYSSQLHSDCNMIVDPQNGKIAGQESRLMVTDEIDPVNACGPAGLDDSAMEVDGPMDLDALRALSSSDWPDITYDMSSQDISVHIPLHRLLSLLLQKALRRCYGELPDLASATSANSSSIFTDFFGQFLGGCHPYGFSAFVMEHPLRIRVFCAEVHAGMWRKNGDAANLSCEWYRSLRWSEQGLELDLFLLQCCASLAPADLYVNRIVNRFGLSSYLSLNHEGSSEYEAVLVQEMLTLIIQIVKERRFCGLTKAESLKRELVHKLAISDATHSQLLKSLPRDLSKFDQLPEILDTIAAYSNPSDFNQGSYSLRWKFWKELDLYYPRWNSRDMQAAEERYLRFRGVSALTTQLPRWTNVYPPFKGVARIATCKGVLQIVRSVLFYAVFSDKSIDSRAPDGVLLTALHLISLALDICFQHKESGDQSCYDGDAIPMLAFAGEEINEGLYFGAGQQSLLSLLVILMRMYKKKNFDNCLEAGGCDLSSLIGSLLKKFAEIDSGCMIKLQLLAPEVIGHVSQSSPNGDAYTAGTISDAEKRKAKARERQAAILEKMKAEQSKFMASIDDDSKPEQEDCNLVEDDSEESAQVVCSLCHDPNSQNPISYLVLLQKSRLLSFMDRGPLSWEQARWIDKKHISITTNEMTDQSGTSTLSGNSGMVPSYPLRQLVQNAVTEFARHGQSRDVDALLDLLKGRFHEVRNIQVPCESSDERKKVLSTFETMEDAMYLSIEKEMHDRMLRTNLTKEMGFSAPEGDQQKTEHTQFMLLGKYIAALSREGTENPSSSENSPDEKVPVDSSRPSAYDGFGPTDCDGIYLSSCGHAVHQGCLDRYLSSLKDRHLRRIVFEGGHIVDPDKGEFLCPVCRGLANSVLPALPELFQEVPKPLHSSVSSLHATVPLVKSDEEINSLQLHQGLARLQYAAMESGKVGNLKGFPLQRCGRMTSNLEPISRLLCKMYFPTKHDKLSGSSRVSHPMLMWGTIKYSLQSMEIAARSDAKYATPSYGLNALYKELESAGSSILSLLLKIVQRESKNSLHVLQRFIGLQSFVGSISFGISADHGSKTSGQGAMLRILKDVDMAVSYPDMQFWNRASDPVLARDPFSSLMWVLFCLPYRFLSCEDSLLSLVHLFYVVSVVQGIITYFGKSQCDISGLGVDDCLVTDISKLMGESVYPQKYFVSNYIGPSSNFENVVRSLSFPYLRRCALLLNLLNSCAQAPFSKSYYVLDRSDAIGDMMDSTYVALAELNEVQEMENMFKIPKMDVIIKDKLVRSIAQKWLHHFCKEFEIQRFQGSIQCEPAVPFQLMRLPHVYHDLLQRYIKQRCPDCESIVDDPALCLLCGRLCTPSWKLCCRESGCPTHAIACGSGTGVFLLIRRTTILLQRSARQAAWPSPYLDAFGEEDPDMHRGKPLYLNKERYAALTHLVASHGLDRSSKVLGQTTIGAFFMV